MTATWSLPTIVSKDGTAPETPFLDLSMTSNGDAMAVWLEEYSNTQILRSNKFTGSTKSWRSSTRQISYVNNSLTPIKVSMSNYGSAITLFTDQLTNISGQYYIKASHYKPDSDMWEIPIVLDQTNITESFPSVDMNNSGDGAAIWIKEVPTGVAIYSSSYQEVTKNGLYQIKYRQ